MILETGMVGAWRVDVTPTDAFAYRRNEHGVYHLYARTAVVRFPVGYRVCKWGTDIPATAKGLANRLAKKLTTPNWQPLRVYVYLEVSGKQAPTPRPPPGQHPRRQAAMSHDLTQTNGTYYFADSRLDSWHQLGQQVGHVMTAAEALREAHLAGWNVRKTPLTTTEITAEGVTSLEVPGQYATIRTNPITGQPEVIGVVGEKYTVMQNEESFDIGDFIVDESGAKWETAGALGRNGRQTFVTMKLPQTISLVTPNGKRDLTELYLAILNSHDGSSATRLLVTPVRIVCRNTQGAAIAAAKSEFAIRHTASASGKVAEAREKLGLVFDYAEAFEREAQRMIARETDDMLAEKLLKQIFGNTDAGIEQEFSTRKANQIAAVMDLYRNSPTIADVRGTRYGLYNAVTEWSDHFQQVQGKDAQYRRAERAALGTSAILKRKAFAVLAK